eukprot:Em0003g1109a
MKAFKHPNVVELIGMCLDSPDGFPLMILPLYPNGNLKAYLQKSRVFSPMVTKLPEGLSTYILIGMCLDIAQGIEYLSTIGYVHRDLAARNCMVDQSLSVKVGDFGLARETSYQASNTQKKPVKWMPPEMLQDGISTEKTDVWAYGVTCWEIFSLGAAPYPGVENNEMLELLCKGLCLLNVAGTMTLRGDHRFLSWYPNYKKLLDTTIIKFILVHKSQFYALYQDSKQFDCLVHYP